MWSILFEPIVIGSELCIQPLSAVDTAINIGRPEGIHC